MGKKYWNNIKSSVSTLSEGLKLTIKHVKESTESRDDHSIASDSYFDDSKGIFTVQYPKESIPVPDNGRYRLHNEIDDCIVCDKCAKVCPVNCIDIEPVKAVDDIGSTSDGTKKRIHAAKFDIDMGKCCFCGLCTTVCPTECLTMTKSYDFSVFDIKEHNYSFAEMSEREILDAKSKAEAQQKERQQKKPAETAVKIAPAGKPQSQKPKAPAFKPRVQSKPKPVDPKPKDDTPANTSEQKPKPKFRPRVPSKPVDKSKDDGLENSSEKPAEKPKFRPKIPKRPKNDSPE